jgi:hypothetical protein
MDISFLRDEGAVSGQTQKRGVELFWIIGEEFGLV